MQMNEVNEAGKTDDDMLRGALPIMLVVMAGIVAWLAFFADIPAGSPYADVQSELSKGIAVFGAALLVFMAVLLLPPPQTDIVAGTAAAVVGASGAVLVFGVVLDGHFLLALAAFFFGIVPLSRWVFRAVRGQGAQQALTPRL